jgi:hypothetical protein
MPQIDTPPAPQRAATEADGRLDVAMRETDYITAVEIDAEAKAAAKATRSHEAARAGTEIEEATGIGEPPVHDAPAHETDALETAGRERVEVDGTADVAPPPRASQPAPRATPAPVKPPLSTAPPSLPPPKTANIPATGPTPACPQCEAPMAWVEEHLRFYCKSCRMYF